MSLNDGNAFSSFSPKLMSCEIARKSKQMGFYESFAVKVLLNYSEASINVD